MLQSMRSSAKYIWWFVVLTFVVVFVFAETSGLTGRGALTRGTTVASVNGTDINYDTWLRAREQRIQQAQAQSPQPLTLDQERRIEDATFDDLVNEILLRQEYERRGITVTDEQIRQAALEQPPQQFLANPEFQTEGQFDIDKYRRFLSSWACSWGLQRAPHSPCSLRTSPQVPTPSTARCRAIDRPAWRGPSPSDDSDRGAGRRPTPLAQDSLAVPWTAAGHIAGV